MKGYKFLGFISCVACHSKVSTYGSKLQIPIKDKQDKVIGWARMFKLKCECGYEVDEKVSNVGIRKYINAHSFFKQKGLNEF